MTEAIASKATGRAFQPSFHFWMTLLMAFFVFGGFGMTYLGPLASGSFPPAPPVVHLHGFVFFSWMVLLVVQSLLVNVKNVRLHRSMGTFGIALATALILFGTLITLVAFSRGSEGIGTSYLSVVAPLTFTALFVMSIRAVRTPTQHRNLILLATISILMPGVNRFYGSGLGLDYVPYAATYLTLDAMIAAIFIHDWRKDGKVGRLTQIGAAIVITPQLFFPLVVGTPWFIAFCNLLGSLVYDR